MNCANPACDRSVFSSCNPHNLTQHSFCSLYCYRYVTDGYKLVPKSDNKHHRNQVKYPVIESHCDSCGKPTELKYYHSKSNRSFCNRSCHNDARKKLKGSKGFLRYMIFRLLRDSPKEWWSAGDIAKFLDDRITLWTLTTSSVSSNLSMFRHLLESRQTGSTKAKEYRFNPLYADYPLVKAMLKQWD